MEEICPYKAGNICRKDLHSSPLHFGSALEPRWDSTHHGQRRSWRAALCGSNRPFGRKVPAALSGETGNYVVCSVLMQLCSTSAGPAPPFVQSLTVSGIDPQCFNSTDPFFLRTQLKSCQQQRWSYRSRGGAERKQQIWGYRHKLGKHNESISRNLKALTCTEWVSWSLVWHWAGTTTQPTGWCQCLPSIIISPVSQDSSDCTE